MHQRYLKLLPFIHHELEIIPDSSKGNPQTNWADEFYVLPSIFTYLLSSELRKQLVVATKVKRNLWTHQTYGTEIFCHSMVWELIPELSGSVLLSTQKRQVDLRKPLPDSPRYLLPTGNMYVGLTHLSTTYKRSSTWSDHYLSISWRKHSLWFLPII